MDYQLEWEAAVLDADFSLDDVKLFRPSTEVAADGETVEAYVPPGFKIVSGGPFGDGDQELLQEANPYTKRHRIFVWAAPEPLLTVARMRHELEHAKQSDCHGTAIQDLQGLLFMALAAKVVGIPGTSDLYDLLPSELDAHAAASRFVRDRHADEVVAVWPTECPAILRSHTGPEPVETLPVRTVAYAAQFASVCEDWSLREHHRPFIECLRAFCPRSVDVWPLLTDSSIRCVQARPATRDAQNME